MAYQQTKISVIFFFNDTATTEIYTLSLHDALPIYREGEDGEDADDPEGEELLYVGEPPPPPEPADVRLILAHHRAGRDRKSTRLNSSHPISRMPSSA